MDISRRVVGLSTPTFRGVIERVKVAEYAKAIHIGNPIHLDRDAAIAAGYRDIVVPTGFITPFSLQSREAKFGSFFINEKKALAGELSWEHRLVICVGDELHGRSVLVDLSEKHGKSPMNILVIETTFFNANDEIAVIVRDKTLEFKE
jgi:hypothetical protein